ncbi:hypothetical protein HER10_EVM0005392 [Colletotrichum scovillei]|uniref:Transcription factor SEF1 n=1 Tax=Colletotrichum scovillei TaxID=1209932 RepID=A0A9P7QTK0_9PEZI|nr:uncharacterized protein HER10_EVM0005392 [Colletotrichum scovillei]KAF4780980.1 hypothetical protein HER10_EVM0005392 [Colletotrichum scovillei]KAG7039148.1 transcription factor SEF1 [Colletotrichum scovillei]KAG7041295.1 transcription factor SEF1 [Colletotrichum scovillei]KAG7061325.1 transcription factor SEF1 [Colletotrichum scovillei]
MFEGCSHAIGREHNLFTILPPVSKTVAFYFFIFISWPSSQTSPSHKAMGVSTAGPVISTSISPHLSPLLEPRDSRVTNESVPGHGQSYGQAGAFSWPPRFFRREPISKNWENTAWVTAHVETKPSEEPGEVMYLTPGEPEEEDPIFFLITEHNWAADKSRVAPLVAFLQRATLEELQQGHHHIPTDNVAILIDGNITKNKVRPRQYLGALSALRLLKELQKNRYHEDDKGGDPIDTESGHEADAERRLIYIVNLSRWAVLALVGSAPESLYRQLADFLLNYILSRPSLGVHFSTDGPETFVMQFSFPYWVWRTSKTLIRDDRAKSSDEGSLRSSQDVTFLRALAGSQAGGEGIDGIYSSHISCIVTGYDQFRWTCILLCEAWFEVEVIGLPTPDSIARYEGEMQDVVDSFGMVDVVNALDKAPLSDPLVRGRSMMLDSSTTMWLPRPYFLRVFEVRLGQIYKEFQGIFYNFDKWITGTGVEHQRLLQRLHKAAGDDQTTISVKDVLDELDNFEDGVLEAEKIVKSFSQTVEAIVSSGDLFMTTDVNYFLHAEGRTGDISACYPYLSQIRRAFTDLRQLRIRFRDLQIQYEEMIQKGVAARDKALLRFKFRKAQPTPDPVPIPASVVVPQQPLVVSISAWMTVISQPLVNIAAIFGCDEIIKFSRTPGNFMISLTLMSLGMPIIIWACIGLTSGGFQRPFINRSRETGTATNANPNLKDNPEQPIDGPATCPIRRRATLHTKFMNWWQRYRAEERLPFRAAVRLVPPPQAGVDLTVLNPRGGANSEEQHHAPNQAGPVAQARERA